MGTLDIFILIFLAIGLLRGIKTGFLKQASSLVSTLLSFVLAASFMESGGRLIELNLGLGTASPLLAFVAIFMMVKLAVNMVAKAADSLIDAANLSGLDRFAGGMVGGLKAAVALSLLFMVVGYAQLPGKPSRETSDFYMPVYRIVPEAWSYLSDRSPAFEDLRQKVEDKLEFDAGTLPI